VFSRSSSRDVKSQAKSRARRAQALARAQAKLARAQAKLVQSQVQGRARQATEQVAPLAKSAQRQFNPLARSAQMTASRGLYGARVWAAPRVERTGVAVQERLAPRVSAMMVATAQRLQPAPAKRRRRWPGILAGIVAVGAGSVAAVLLRGKRGSTMAMPGSVTSAPTSPMPSAGSPEGERESATTTQVDVNGQVRTP